MAKTQTDTGEHVALATADEVKRILGDLDDARIVEILGLQPTIVDLEQAAIWAAGNGDVLDKAGQPLVGTAAEIFDILASDEEEERPPTG